VPLDLQAAIVALFERYRYAELIDYGEAPPAPAFALDDAQWVVAQVQRWQARGGGDANHPDGGGG
jgi:hypothetical protein